MKDRKSFRNYLVELLDHLSEQPKLYSKGRNRYSTILGMSLTVLSYLTIGVFAMYFFYHFIMENSYNIIFYELAIKNIFNYNINSEPFTFSL
jgi:hypothetical protein